MALWLSLFCGFSSRCRGLVCSVWLWHFLVINICGSRLFYQRKSNFEQRFFVVVVLIYEGRQLYMGLHRPASKTPFKWRFAGLQMMGQQVAMWFFRRSGPVLLRNPFLFLRGVRTPATPSPSGSAHDTLHFLARRLKAWLMEISIRSNRSLVNPIYNWYINNDISNHEYVSPNVPIDFSIFCRLNLRQIWQVWHDLLILT